MRWRTGCSLAARSETDPIRLAVGATAFFENPYDAPGVSDALATVMPYLNIFQKQK